MKLFGPLRRLSQPLSRLRGFTLVELMVVLAIAAILALIAAPAFTEIINLTRRRAYANQLYEDLAFARNEAIKRGVPVTACPSTDGTTCSGAATWSSGWIVFVDPTSVGNPAAGSVLKVHEPLASGWIATKNNNSLPFGHPYVSYGALGTPGGGTNFRLAICPASANCDTTTQSNQTNLVMTGLGRIRIDTFN